MSKIKDFVQKIKKMKNNSDVLRAHSINLGWVGSPKEKTRTIPKKNADFSELKGKKSKISNFDSDFIGPGQSAASYATIAKTLCYGRAGGVSKDGREYGRIPPRNFVEVLKRKHLKPLQKEIIKNVLNTDEINQSFDIQQFGVIAKGQLQRAMRDSNEYPRNAPITISGGWMANPKHKLPFSIEPKKSGRPLIDTGNLIRSVDFEIE